ncbi:tetratricopeptide repeat protein [Dactylosporangium aurantiacum]|uniref:Tetratricopeptide repeat protein n=1 Tax=Dactylosporangium aurantiacum TaxID=35754 RepID=A0A9Q9IPZ3_9ACTN|nr:BTAD domain-containing putative transcriptional regulator [Dactylosporangium aurantiacum]MDG6109977.1 BTAD domain-containing putative transcriptional regulator [Dactylosporangium aurantiacum]UWZ57274.1 tetratricopeptide repeat protein [Dactylosporangium aurantiacum]
MWFGILGPLEVRADGGEPVAVGGPKPRALLTVLLLNAGQVVAADRFAAGSANAVQAQVSRLRRCLPAGLVEFTGGGYRLAVDPDDVDVHRFERLAREGRRLLAAGAAPRAVPALREALALWRGPALADLPDAGAQRARLDELRLTAVEDLVEAELATPAGTCVADLRGLVAEHPFRERLAGQLMRALHAAGRTAAALAEYDRVRRLLADELGADPSPDLAAIHLAILRAQPPAAASAAPGALTGPAPAAAGPAADAALAAGGIAVPARQGPPAQLTSFVGRDRELAALARHIAPGGGARLVTVTGPGGIGKTRLAVEAAGRASRGTCFADLSRLDSGAQVPAAVLGALGLREAGFPAPAADPVRLLTGALRDTGLLLVLDNCEQVLDAAANLARTLLTACPGLTVLATSREPLGLTGETLLPLAPLDTAPPAGRSAVVAPAVRLFADRAAAARPGFALTPGTAGQVAGICAALDGLPLAIELAAARLRHLDVAGIADRLTGDDHFRLLSRGDRTAAERHRTLRAVVDWSWQLLRPEEQALARRLAVFTGGAPLDAVEAVCGVPDAAEVLADLVDRSLVSVRDGRCTMLGTIHLYCRERLAEAGEEPALRRAHARHQLALARRADPFLRRAEQLEWLAVLSAEHENLMAALRWAVREDRPTAMRLVAALAAYWWLGGRRTGVGDLAAELLDDVPDGLDEEYVSCVVHAEARAGAGHRRRADDIMRTMRGPLRHPFGAAVWGMTTTSEHATRTPSARLLGDDPWNVALGRLGFAMLAVLDGRTGDGEAELRAVLASFRTVGERWGTAQALDGLAGVAAWRGEWARAHELWREALALLDELGAGLESADVLCRRAEAHRRQGDLAAAAADLRRAAGLSAAAGRPDTSLVALGLGEVARHAGDLIEAARRLERALAGAAAGEPGAAYTTAPILTALARAAETAGRVDEAARRHREALAAARQMPLAATLAAVAEGLAGHACRTAGRAGAERGAVLLGAAVALRGTAVTGDVDVARTAAAARAALGPEAFAAAYARGAAMTRDQALTTLDAAAPPER